jgi:hypothetical protein
VIVHDLHIVGVPVVPDRGRCGAIVNSNAVLTTPVARERLEPVTGKRRQVAEFSSRVQLLQFPLSDSAPPAPSAAELTGEQRLGFGILERPNHLNSRV